MKVFRSMLVLFLLALCLPGWSQPVIDSVLFFKDETPLVVTLSTDLGNLMSGKIKEEYQPATFACKHPDGSTISEEIRLNLRGHSRRTICNIPPIRLSFRNPASPRLSPLRNLKLVSECKSGSDYEQYLLKEYLVYKIYNIITEKSFRVRLLKMTYQDNVGKKKPFTKNAFVIENVDALSKRLHCKELNNLKLSSENTNREQMTIVNLFEYMIGNTDWSVPNNHNVKLLRIKKDSMALPYPIPYDFDYSGLVNADYAVPDEIMGIESVVQRVYRGFPRNMEELKTGIAVFNQHKEEIDALVNNSELISGYSKKEISNYLNDFYKIINDQKEVQRIFIDNARKK
jgi:hypothetical protein